MGLINIISDRKNVTLDSNVILYIIMHGKIAEIHIVGGKVYKTRVTLKDLEGLLKEDFVKIHRGCIVSVKAIHDVTDTVDLSNGEELLYTVRKKKQIVTEIQEKQKRMINALGKRGIPATEDFKGHCGCILFDLDWIKAVDSSNNIHKIWNTYLRKCIK